MALQIEKPGKTEDYILVADRESSAPTIFKLRPLSWEQGSEIGELAALTHVQAMKIAAITAASREEKRPLNEDEVQRVNEVVPMDAKAANRLNLQHALAVKYGVLDIAGLIDEEGLPIKMTGAEFSRVAPVAVLQELGSRIMEISRYSEVAIKK